MPIIPVRSNRIKFTQPKYKQLSAAMQHDAIIDDTITNFLIHNPLPHLVCTANAASGSWTPA